MAVWAESIPIDAIHQHHGPYKSDIFLLQTAITMTCVT